MLQTAIDLYKNAYRGLPKTIWWLSLVMLVNRAGTMVIPFLTLYLTDKGFTLAQAGYAMAAFGVGAIAGGYLGGRLTDKFGFYHVQFVSLFCNGAMFFVLAQMQTLPQIIICIFILSTLGESFRPANAAAIAYHSNDANRIRAYSLNRLAINLGWAVGPAMGGIIAEHSFKWLFWVDGTTCVMASFILFITQKPVPLLVSDRKPETVKNESAFRDMLFLKGMFLIFLVGVCFFQLFNVVSFYFEEEIEMSKSSIGYLLGMNGLIIFLVEMVLVYKLDGRYNSFNYIISGTFLIGISFFILNIAPVISVALISMLVITFGEMLLFPFINNFWVRRSNQYNRGQYASVYTMAFAASQVLAPTYASTVAHRIGFFWLWNINFAICLLAMIGFIQLKKQSKLYERI